MIKSTTEKKNTNPKRVTHGKQLLSLLYAAPCVGESENESESYNASQTHT
jgi:hypothetical protein